MTYYFFLLHKLFDVYKVELFVYKLILIVTVYTKKLKIGMLDHMNNIFGSTIFKISVDVPLSR